MFVWGNSEEISEGRRNLGEDVPVLIYRMMQCAMLDALSNVCGTEKANGYLRQAGVLAGMEFARHLLDLQQELSVFLADLQKKLREKKIGILRIEAFDDKTGKIVLTLSEDLNGHGLLASNETASHYDEGFFAGILEAYMGIKYEVREVDCWVNSDRVCRLTGIPKSPDNVLNGEKVDDCGFY